MAVKYQVWAQLSRQWDDGLAWVPVTRSYIDRKVADRIAKALWLTTRIDEIQED
jgi:hypothetical protein